MQVSAIDSSEMSSVHYSYMCESSQTSDYLKFLSTGNLQVLNIRPRNPVEVTLKEKKQNKLL